MRKRVAIMLAMACTVIVAFSAIASAQETAADKPNTQTAAYSYYKLDFSVREMDNGKTLNTRSYTINMKNGGGGSSIRVGTRVPYSTEKGPSYMDVGFNVDCRIDERQALEIRTDLSSLPTGDQVQETGGMPLIRSLRSSSVIPIALNKPILVASVDELGSTHKMQVEVTITQMK